MEQTEIAFFHRIVRTPPSSDTHFPCVSTVTVGFKIQFDSVIIFIIDRVSNCTDRRVVHSDLVNRIRQGLYACPPSIVYDVVQLPIFLAVFMTVIVGDIFVPDGLTDHEPFSFDHYHSRLEARVDDSLVCADAVDLRPDERDPRDPATVGEHAVVGTLYVFAPSADADALADTIHDRLTDHEVAAGASVLKDDAGVTVRALGDRSADVTAAVEAAWDEARQTLLGTGAPLEGRGR